MTMKSRTGWVAMAVTMARAAATQGGPNPPGGIEDGETSEGEDDSAYGEGGFENECHFQAIDRTLTRASVATWDLERGFSSNLGLLASPSGDGWDSPFTGLAIDVHGRLVPRSCCGG